MMLLIGWGIVIGSVLGGFIWAGGNLKSLVVPSEYAIILGVATGYVVGASPTPVLKLTIHKILTVMKGSPYSRQMFLDLIQMLYELLMIAREQGVVGIEEHVVSPSTSSIFTKYPSFLNDHHSVAFMQDAMRPIIDGKVKGDQMKAALDDDLYRMHQFHQHPINVLSKAADALPGIGIVAAVLGVIITMGHISGSKQEIGEHVASALTGTFLGIWVAYGFMQPMVMAIEFLNIDEAAYFEVMSCMIVAYATGSPPIMAAEAGRRAIPMDRQPTSEELETMLKSIGKKG